MHINSFAKVVLIEKPILELNSDYLTSNKTVKKWLKGDFVEFKWTGDKFIIDAIGFE